MKNLFIISILLFSFFSCTRESNEELNYSVSNNLMQNKDPNPTILPSTNGDFIKVTNNGQIYYCFRFMGQWRHVSSPLTWNGLFTSPKFFRYSFNSFEEAVVMTGKGFSSPLLPDNGLINDVTTGKLYFREGNDLRWIPNMTICNNYKFNINVRQNVNSVSSYNILSDLN